ncbi:hypothetical protein, partial [Leptolyngbya sp. FACHB-16]|uniref:hypothetical protein n=1 Tax=unclassified Leptolyngbya TaxID=2650499 RepID=UPI001A7E4BC9
SGPKTARLWRAVFGHQSQEFTPVGRELLALMPILRIAVIIMVSQAAILTFGTMNSDRAAALPIRGRVRY